MSRAVVAAAFAASALTLSHAPACEDDGAAKTPQAGEGDEARCKAEFSTMYKSYLCCFDAAKVQDARTFNQSRAVQACKKAQQRAIAVRLLLQKLARSPAVKIMDEKSSEAKRVSSEALKKLLGPTSASPRDAGAVVGMQLAGGGGSSVTVGISPSDRDGDFIPDALDACPNEKGKPDPDSPEKNGCPRSIRVMASQISILQRVQFDTDKAIITKAGDELLDEVAGVLKEHPEITKIEVQGHADSSGARLHNQQLSQARAVSVMNALVVRGIDKVRFTAKGYGQDVPIADNGTAQGRQLNRRAQFAIVETQAKLVRPMEVGPRAGVLEDNLAPGPDPLKE
ncbi:OmpA family protein [Sorangium sp. So ce388]|uniref:OmpA family protein n=1 Tax=Sorangium sp. So ce388 TaxID=3133309 RepID=UPI003F5C1797